MSLFSTLGAPAGALTLAVVARVKKRMTIEQFLTRATWLARPRSPPLDPPCRPRTVRSLPLGAPGPPDLPRRRARNAPRSTRHAARGRPLTSPRCHRPRPTCHDVARGAPLARPATPPADGPLT